MYRPKYPSGTGARAALFGHPLHPMIVPIPIAALVGVAITDWVHLNTANEFWPLASYWLLIAGLISGVVAAGLGLIDLAGISRARSMGIGWAHAIGNVIVLGLSLVNFLIRRDSPLDPPGEAIILSTIVFGGLLLTGWLGGELAFRHGIGVSAGVGKRDDSENLDVTPSGREDVGKL
jgi:uncharacterized membrane protein